MLQYWQSLIPNKRQFLVLAAVLIVGLLLGFTAGRPQTGRYVMHVVQEKGSTKALWRYDTFTGKTWGFFPSDALPWWREVPESGREAVEATKFELTETPKLQAECGRDAETLERQSKERLKKDVEEFKKRFDKEWEDKKRDEAERKAK
jgi:hypothetical protein